MKYVFFVCHINLLFIIINCKHVDQRHGRLFNGAYTNTVWKTNIVTSLIPSSCVQIDPTLLPCRNVRFLKFPYFAPKNQNTTTIVHGKEDSDVHTTPMGWGEYLGIYAPTVTVTHTKLQTTIVQDPRVVVTYAVKGCIPMKLPNELERCPFPENSIPPIEEIIPTSTVASPFQPATSVMYDQFNPVSDMVNNDINTNQQVIDVISSSTDAAIEDFQSVRPTEALPTTVSNEK